MFSVQHGFHPAGSGATLEVAVEVAVLFVWGSKWKLRFYSEDFHAKLRCSFIYRMFTLRLRFYSLDSHVEVAVLFIRVSTLKLWPNSQGTRVRVAVLFVT